MALPPGFGINLVASIGANVGVGTAARSTARTLEARGVAHAIVPTGHDWGGTLPIAEFDSRLARTEQPLLHPVNVYVLPLVAFETIFQRCPWLLAPRRMHVAMLWWEASALPPSWIDGLNRLDAVLAGSAFIADLAANGLELMPVIDAPVALAIPAGIVADRGRFGLPARATVFAASFDPNSDPARKNPVGHIQAFRMAFGPEVADVHLAIRMNNAHTQLGQGALAEMRQAAAGDARVSFVLEPLDYEGVLTFFSSSDVHVSLHRGEGLGLGILESMMLGKPAIATAWSGNMSFMDLACGCPVRYKRTRVIGNWRFFQPSFLPARAFWAEPMLDDAAGWMRRLHADRDLRMRLGAEAQKAADAYQARANAARWIDALATLWEAQRFLAVAPNKHSAAGA